MEKFQVELCDIIEEFQLKILCCSEMIKKIQVDTPDINRPGLELAGYSENFSKTRIQIMGMVEMSYLKDLSMQTRKKKLEAFFSLTFPCLIIARGLKVFPEMIILAKKYNIPILSSSETTTEFFSSLSRFLNLQLAQREMIHACLVEVYGEGVLIMGNSGVGKSETALELLKRGHRLVADDLVEIRKVSNRTLVGAAPEIIRHFIEIRGVGFLDVRRLYGVGAVKVSESIQLVINLEHWDESKDYDRVGLDTQYTNILGLDIPSLMIPVQPGRNLAIIVEVAAMNNRQKCMGYNAAEEINKRVFENMDTEASSVKKRGSFKIQDPWR